MVRRADVARHAGVTPAVVSYVTNGSHPVSTATRHRVLAAIEELGYRPNAVARALATSRTHTIGLVTPDSANPFFAELAAAIELAASAVGYTVLLGNALNDEERELNYANTFADRQVDGMIIAPVSRAEAALTAVRARGIPVVYTDRTSHDSGAPMVEVDNAAGARRATAHLLGHGRTVHACITGHEKEFPATERARGWREALVEAGVQVRDDLLVFTDFTTDAAYREAQRLLALEPAIDSILVGSDLQAIGVLRAIFDHGRTPGADVSVVSFDGIQIGRYTHPSLTTVAQPFEPMAAAVMELLEGLIEAPQTDANPGITRVLPTELVIRESCGCTPHQNLPDSGAAGELAGIPSNPTQGVR